MNRVTATPKRDISMELGDAPEEEYTFLLVPVAAYSLVSQIARRDGCSVGEVFQKALLQYLHNAEVDSNPEAHRPARAEPAIVVKRRRP